MATYKVGQKVHVRDKEVEGKIAYIGSTEFAPGVWVGIILDEPKGKNNGSVKGKAYFECGENHGMFVRQSQLNQIADVLTEPAATKSVSPRSPNEASGLKKPGIPTPGGATAKSRLPAPGTGPTGGRSPSFTNLKLKDRSSMQSSQSQSLTRERSFIETNFVETLKQPQVQVQTPQRIIGSSAAASPASPAVLAAQKAAETLDEKKANAALGLELTKAKDEIIDLKEKLETLKLKRAKDQEKIKEFEKIRIQYEQLVEFKSKIMESQAMLQKELQKAKHEAKEAIEAKEQHAEEMAELSETVEMITLDKEMAEEKAETLQMELDAVKDKVEELTTDLEIIKAESESTEPSGEGGVTNVEYNILQEQNRKLRDSVVQLRDFSAQEKSKAINLQREVEELRTRNTDLGKSSDKLKVENETLESQIGELQEQVDAALGAEEMVENLTTKCLDLEDKYNSINEEKLDLEKLHEMDEELLENARELELELREDIDMANGKIRELERAREVAFEVIADHEATIHKFRDLVNKVQDQNAELRSALENKKPEAASNMEMIDFKKMLAETKAFSKAIDMELRQCEIDQANLHVRYLNSYMSESFMARGGDNEAILVLLLVPRMLWKVSILSSQIKDKFGAVEFNKSSDIFKNHDVERFTFGLHMVLKLSSLELTLNLYNKALGCCTPEVFLRMGTLYPEMSAHERAVDFYIELLRKDQLDENVPIETIEKSLHYFQQIFPMHLGQQGDYLDHVQVLADSLKMYSAGIESLSQLSLMVKALMTPNTDSEMANVLKVIEANCNEMKTTLKAMRRRLPGGTKLDFSPTEPLLKYDHQVYEKLMANEKSLTKIVKALYLCSRQALQVNAEVPPAKLKDFLNMAADQTYDLDDNGLDIIVKDVQEVYKSLNDLNKSLQDGEWDSNDPPLKPNAPVILRAEIFKAEIKEAESMKYKLENKDLDIKELKKSLKLKSDEMSELQVRKDKAEKRLADATREAELMREKLQRKLDDAQETLKRKEKEFEDTMDHLQKDLESLESERGELKNKLKETTMKALLEGIARGSPGSSGSSAPMSMGPSIPAPVKDSPLLTRQLQDLQMALVAIREESRRSKGQELKQRLANMKPIVVPSNSSFDRESPVQEKKDASKEDISSLEDLAKKLGSLRSKIKKAMVDGNQVVDLQQPSMDSLKMSQENPAFVPTEKEPNRVLYQKELSLETENLKLEIARLIASRKPGGQVEADFAAFPSPLMARAMLEQKCSRVGKVRLPTSAKMIKTVPLIVGPQELKQIHQAVLA